MNGPKTGLKSLTEAPVARLGSFDQLRQNSRWIMEHAANVTSQFGEDGIIARALALIPNLTKWCVEFGAWDGQKHSNTWDLIAKHEYRGVLIEANPERFKELKKTHNSSINILLNALVGFGSEDGLDALLAQTPIPKSFDLLSIDIDGNDYHVWNAVTKYRPKLVVIEYNPTAANAVEFRQEARPGVCQGSSAAALVRLAKSKNYELVAVTVTNLVFVAAEYYPLFKILDNSLVLMRDDTGSPQIFVGYDGHVFLAEANNLGQISIPWHGLTLREEQIQILSHRLQKYPDLYARSDRFLYRCSFGFQKLRRRATSTIRSRLADRIKWAVLSRLYRLPPIELSSIALEPAGEMDDPILEDVCMPPFVDGKTHDDLGAALRIARTLRPTLVCEIGTAHGNLAANLLKVCPHAGLITVNATAELQTGNVVSYSLDAREIGRVYRKYGYEPRVQQVLVNSLNLDLHRYTSLESIDLVIIDGCHDIPFVLNDFEKVRRFVRPGGVVLFHDTNPSQERHLAGSYRACLLLRRREVDVRWIRGTWWGYWRKPVGDPKAVPESQSSGVTR